MADAAPIFFDSHAHLEDARFDEDRDTLIAGLPERGIRFCLNAGADLASSRRAAALARAYPFLFASAGVHPHDAQGVPPNYLAVLTELAKEEKVVAIGEIGLDYYYDHSPRTEQRVRFCEQMDLAETLSLPIIVHDREAHGEMLDLLKARPLRPRPGVLHCFSGSYEMAKVCLDMGYFISLGGPVTYKNAVKTIEVARKIPLNRLLIETDSPYLAPHPHRGKRNDPGYVRLVAEAIAALRGVSAEEIAKAALENGIELFSLDPFR